MSKRNQKFQISVHPVMTAPAEQAGQHEPTQANPPQWPDPQQAMRLMANLMADDVAAN